MKTSPEHSPAETNTAFDLSGFFRRNMRSGYLASLILMLSGLHLHVFVPPAFAESFTVAKNGGERQWSIQVDEVDSGDVSPDPFLAAEIDRDLLGELVRTKQFNRVLPSDDRNANNVPDLLTLKTTVQRYAPGSKTRRATLDDVGLLGVVPGLFLRFWGRTTVSGSTKLKIRIQLYTREGHLVLESVFRQNVRSILYPLQATQKLAHNVAVILNRSTLPELATTPPGQEAPKTPKSQVGTVTGARCHQAADADPSLTRCEVCVRVGNTAYSALIAPPLGTDSVRYAAGRELLVVVGDDTITYKDKLGNSLQMAILSRTTVTPQDNR
jgi:hypothetical protein